MPALPGDDTVPALALDGRGQEIQDHYPERARLTAGQAAAELAVLTDGNRVSVINGPAWSGEDVGDDRSRPHQGRIWAAAGRGPVIGITPARSARSTWAAGVAGSCNTARFLITCPPSAAPAAAGYRRGHLAAGRRVLDDPRSGPG